MRHLSAIGLIAISLAITCTGCTSYTSTPTINEPAETKTKETISSYTYEIDSPWKGSRFGSDAYKATQKIIPNAQDNTSKLTAPPLSTLEIKLSESSSGGACTQEYLTGLSLGLIPSWCTRPELFTFHFRLNNDHGLCRQKTYSISSTTFSHLTAIPFAIVDTDNKPLTLYQAALEDFLQKDQCET
ncbi:hypothetical protein [Pseudomonas poae]|uniref:Uncharacterized protein n=1 Tax=Pseudomonas poae TaxID=200451 RepID=A0A2S9E8K9_9PSED|nr:hypothetical protein [Pseudomonas poae]PRA31491.1 hypothetical protein CQZ97_08670 [Pseudomonas poae]PRC11170.1 hypothetical protein CQZ99_26495 [Pseudomonas poae]